MIKIVDREKHKIKECDFCRFKLEYTNDDIITEMSTTQTHKVKYKTNYIVCPDCNGKITLAIQIV